MAEISTQDRLPEGYRDHFLVKLDSFNGSIGSDDSGQFSQKLAEGVGQSVIEGKPWKIVLDMSEIEYMSSAAFRALLVAKRQVAKDERGGEIVLANCQKPILDVLTLTGLTQSFKQIELLPEGPIVHER